MVPYGGVGERGELLPPFYIPILRIFRHQLLSAAAVAAALRLSQTKLPKTLRLGGTKSLAAALFMSSVAGSGPTARYAHGWSSHGSADSRTLLEFQLGKRSLLGVGSGSFTGISDGNPADYD